jgi:hypothetical protein
VYQVVAVSGFIATQFGTTLASSDDITAGNLSQSILVLSMFGSLWILLAVTLLYLFWRDWKVSKKKSDEGRYKAEGEGEGGGGEGGTGSDTLEGRVELFMSYLTESFNPVFLQERWSWQGMKEAVVNNHAWHQVSWKTSWGAITPPSSTDCHILT